MKNSPGQEDDQGIPFFRKILVIESERLTRLCDTWDKKLATSGNSMSENVQGSIRSVTGQGRLVMRERFTQFSDLVDNCELDRGEKPTTLTDLMGFWDMIYVQVEDVEKKFNVLAQGEANKWEEVEVDFPKVVEKRSRIKSGSFVKSKGASSSGLRELIKARREGIKLEDVKKSEDTVTVKKSSDVDDEKQFDGVFFSIQSPVVLKSPMLTRSTGGQRRKIVTNKNLGLVSPFVSHCGKRDIVRLTASPVRNSTRGRLFKDEEGDILEGHGDFDHGGNKDYIQKGKDCDIPEGDGLGKNGKHIVKNLDDNFLSEEQHLPKVVLTNTSNSKDTIPSAS